MRERRAFNFYPRVHRTDTNNRETYLLDDPLFEPEQFEYRTGFIGDRSIFTEKDLDRTPMLETLSNKRQIEQFQIGTAYVDPDTKVCSGGAFVDDLINQIDLNGGLVNDQNRLFQQNMYVWTPPIDYDKFVHYSRYFWVGPGDADLNGEYITKEPSGSMTVLYRFNGTGFERIQATLVTSLPVSSTNGSLVELASDPKRPVFRWENNTWTRIITRIVDDLPEDIAPYSEGDHLYICRTGPDFNRPLVWQYSKGAGRWVAQPVVVSFTYPVDPHEGTIWENTTISPYRKFQRFEDNRWVDLVYTPGIPDGDGQDGEFRYDTRSYTDLDTWSKQNWWRHQKDISLIDQAANNTGSQALRPILEFFDCIEASTDDVRDFRNKVPQFKMYKYDLESVSSANLTTPIITYRIGTGFPDGPLGFALSYDANGEFEFDMDLQQVETDFKGYRLYKNTHTGRYHAIWRRSNDPIYVGRQTDDQNTSDVIQYVYQVPEALRTNADHAVLKSLTRTKVIHHLDSVIQNQSDGGGDINSFRWTMKDPEKGALLLDPEHSMLLPLALLQDPKLSIPDSIRFVQKEYNQFWNRFTRKMNDYWSKASISDGTGVLIQLTPDQVIDVILTDLYAGRNDSYLYHFSGMGTFKETRISNGSAVVVDPTNRPIYVPASAAKIGCVPTYVPSRFNDAGIDYLRGHDGMVIPSYGDDRDRVWLALHDRMYAEVDVLLKTENETLSARHDGASFLQDFYGNFYPSNAKVVKDVVLDYNDIENPVTGQWYASRTGPVYAIFDGANWSTVPIAVDEIIHIETTESYFVYNGIVINEIRTFNRGTKYYSSTDFRRIIRREFERWTIDFNLDYLTNSDFDRNNPFTWNYASSGLEGNYRSIYRRMYYTTRPHSHPWEVMGYSIEPSWWRSQYVPTTVAPDGTPRYSDSHGMWEDFRNGLVHPPKNLIKDEFKMVAPIPVDADGELLNPIQIGIVEESHLDERRIDDGWMFGDGGPVEELYYNSGHYRFAMVLAAYLMRPLEWLATKWDDQAYYSHVWSGKPHLIRKDVLTRSPIADTTFHLADKTPVVGLNMWIADFNIYHGVGVENLIKTIRNTAPLLAWKTFGFINPERTTYGFLDGQEVPYEDATVVAYKSQPVRSEVASGIYVVRESSGYRVYGFDYTDPFFRIEAPAIPVQAGQVEKKEYFIAAQDQHRFVLNDLNLPTAGKANDTAKAAVLVNGMKLRSEFVKFVDSKTFEIDPVVIINGGENVVLAMMTAISNTQTMQKKFTIAGVDFFYYSEGSDQYVDIPYGTFFPTATDVINFMVGYGRYLAGRGWVFDDFQDGDSDLRDYLAGAKSFATWLTQISNPRVMRVTYQADFDQFYFSPFAKKAVFESPFGQIDTLETIQNGLYGIINKRGEPIPPQKLSLLKIGNGLKLESNEIETREGENQMFAVRVNVSEIQHVVFFSQTTRFAQVVYDPVLGLHRPAMRIETYKTREWNGQYDAPGYLIGDQKLLPNLEKQAKDFTRYYDRIDPVDDPVKWEQATNLYGYYPMDSYMDAIQADQRSRFDYYRGMIHAKGTIRAIRAYTKGTRVGPGNVQVLEDWMWKVSEYGDDNRYEVQFRIFHTDFLDRVQTIRFGANDAENRSINIPDFDRSDPSANTRWLIPTRDTSGPISEFRIPTVNFQIDRDVSYTLHIFDTDAIEDKFILRHSYYDPLEGKFDRDALALIDYRFFYDPALYNVGPKEASSYNLIWGPEQVGKTWWRQSLLQYENYKKYIPLYEKCAAEWGRLRYATARIYQVGDITNIDLLDPVTRQPYQHGFPQLQYVLITITGANQPEYNKTAVYALVSGTSQLQLPSDGVYGEATGNIVVQLGHVEVFEWIESPVPPQDWVDYNSKLPEQEQMGGIPFQTDVPYQSPSYSVMEAVDANGRTNRKYYFWMKSYTGERNNRSLTTEQIARRLANPTQEGVPWFAPVDASSLIVYSGGEKIKDTYAISFVMDTTIRNSHDEWVLITENDTLNPPPIQIENKIIDSLSRRDRFGNPVPDPFLIEDEIHGFRQYPAQTLFKDLPLAFSVWITAQNKVLSRKSMRDDDFLLRYFPLHNEYPTDPNGFWSRSGYRLEEYEGKAVYEIVPTYEVRDERFDNGYYFTGDIVRVLNSVNTDPWTDDPVYTDYLYNGDTWVEIGAGSQTIVIREEIFNDAVRFRGLYVDLKSVMSFWERNKVVFSVLYEMLRQHSDCMWFIKTSYLNLHVYDQFKRERYVHPNEVTAIINNINDVKPFHSKLRDKEIVFTLENETERMDVQVQDSAVVSTTLVFDRLSSNLNDEYAWDVPHYDQEPGWSRAFWEIEDVGRDEWRTIGTLTGSVSETRYVIPSRYTPALYRQRLRLFSMIDNSEIDMEEIGISFIMTLRPTEIVVDFTTPLGTAIRGELHQTIGFYDGNEPKTAFVDYYHQAARVIVAQDYDALSLIGDAGVFHGEAPERAVTEMRDSAVILVRDYSSVGEHDFMVTMAQSPEIPPGLEFFALSSEFTMTGQSFVTGETGYKIGRIERIPPGGGTPIILVAGTDYNISADVIVELTTPPAVNSIVRIVYSGWPVGPLGAYRVLYAPGRYEIENDYMYKAIDYTEWDEVHKDSQIVLNSPQEVMSTVDIARTGRALGVIGESDKIFFSVIFDGLEPSTSAGVGLMNNTFVFDQENTIGMVGNHNIGLYNSGNLMMNGSINAVFEPFSNGDVVDVAVNRGTNYIWFRVNGGNWNNSVAANPELNIGGFGIAFITGDLYPAYTMLSGPDEQTRITANGNFGATPYEYAPPQGFVNVKRREFLSDLIKVEHLYPRNDSNPLSLIHMTDYVVDEVVSVYNQYDAPLGFEINRRVGTLHLDATTFDVWSWNGNFWFRVLVLSPNKTVVERRTGSVWTYDGTTLEKTYSPGDPIVSPALEYPPFGQGIGYGTAYYGEAPGASVSHPSAYAVMQHGLLV